MRQQNMLRCLVPLLGLTLLVALAVLYAVDFKDYHRSLATIFGFNTGPYPFFDWEYIGAGIKCWSQGINVYAADPCDLLNRPHDYSPLWLRAVFIPTGRAWTMPVGVGIALAFLISLYWLVRPANWRELIIFALACISPMVVYCLERGNADAVIFIMLVIAGVLGAGPPANRILSYALILLAGLLKFYPLVALSTALRERPRGFFAIAATAGVIVVGFVYRFRDELPAAFKNIPRVGWGAVSLPFDGPGLALHLFPGLEQSGWFTDLPYALLGVLLILTAIQVVHFARNGNMAAAFRKMPERDAIFLIIGAAVIAGCFFAGYSKAHRGVHLIFVVVGLVAMRRTADDTAARAMLGWTIMIVLFLMWERFFRIALANPDEIPVSGFALSAYLLLWLFLQVLWWRLAAVLLGVLAIFVINSELFAALQRWRGLHREAQIETYR